jgi:hypothetical protein
VVNEDQTLQVPIEGLVHEEHEGSHQAFEEDIAHEEENDEESSQELTLEEASPSSSIHEEDGLVRHNSLQIFKLNDTHIEDELYSD